MTPSVYYRLCTEVVVYILLFAWDWRIGLGVYVLHCLALSLWAAMKRSSQELTKTLFRESCKAMTFQSRVAPWMQACFGPAISADVTERNHRFIEEALELVQASGATRSEAHQLVDYVYDRPVGQPPQEVGGVMVTLAALCLARGLDMHECGEVELARIWTCVEKIRAKQAAKPKHSPLPSFVSPKES